MTTVRRKMTTKTLKPLAWDGCFRDVYIPADVFSELREIVSERERLQEPIISLSN